MDKMPRSLLERFMEWYATQKPTYTDTPSTMYGYGNSLEKKGVETGYMMDKQRRGTTPDYYNLDDLYRKGPPNKLMLQLLQNDLDLMMNEHVRSKQVMPQFMKDRDRDLFPGGEWEAPIYGRGRRM